VYNVKEGPNKYIWNFFTPQIIDKASLSICGKLWKHIKHRYVKDAEDDDE